MNILSEIAETKRQEIFQKKQKVSENEIKKLWDYVPESMKKRRGFIRHLEDTGMKLIAEVKKASPSAGIIRADFNPVQIAKIYEANGASCISVLTDFPYFQGDLGYLTQIREGIALPLLRKDFIIDCYQLYEALLAGADAVLLIAELLSDSEMSFLYRAATELGLDVLVEFHQRDQLRRVIDLNCRLIGINNRDLSTFKTDLNHTLELLPLLPKDRLVVSESGIRHHDDWLLLQRHGLKAVLVGESLMRCPDIAQATRLLMNGAI